MISSAYSSYIAKNLPLPAALVDVKLTHFAARRNITHAVNISAVGYITCPQGKHRSKTKSTSYEVLFLSMGYKKDILAVFAYEFELLQFSLEHISLKILISLFINSTLMPFNDGI